MTNGSCVTRNKLKSVFRLAWQDTGYTFGCFLAIQLFSSSAFSMGQTRSPQWERVITGSYVTWSRLKRVSVWLGRKCWFLDPSAKILFLFFSSQISGSVSRSLGFPNNQLCMYGLYTTHIEYSKCTVFLIIFKNWAGSMKEHGVEQKSKKKWCNIVALSPGLPMFFNIILEKYIGRPGDKAILFVENDSHSQIPQPVGHIP